ncbi:MAG: 4-hydroxythreonine-4-phosphate dehydrogenase [Glaciecola sp.]|jgi:4-hydroxythreonine-4-phosphate dehydrogenase
MSRCLLLKKTQEMISSKDIKIGITQGDPNGIGYEVIIKTLADTRMLELYTPVIYGNKSALNHHMTVVNDENFKFQSIASATEAKINATNFINCGEGDFEVDPGNGTKESGASAFAALEKAVADLKNGEIDVLVTAPINKDNIQSESFSFPGHTEYLASVDDNSTNLMFMVSDKLKIGVVTGHIPLSEISKQLNLEIIVEKIRVMAASLRLDFSIRKPKIAVLGLNPHAGDNGLIGKEDEKIISPAIKDARSRGILAYGPFAADGFFGSGNYANYDGVIAMYHDQGLIPFKTIAFGEGTNFTAGLSFVRTSPDHGTGFDIAGKNKADESSLRQAIYTGIDIFKNRTLNQDLLSNQLTVKPAQKRNFTARQ